MRVVVYLLIILLIASPASSSMVSLNRWVLNITLNENGSVEEVIQVELQNKASSTLDGFSFVIPASKITINYDQIVSIPSTGQVVKQEVVPQGTRIIISFNESVKAGGTWDGRVAFTVDDWAVKQGNEYSIDIPVEAPSAIVSEKSAAVELPEDADIRAQVFLPESVEVTSITPVPFRVLFQYDHMVPTWTPDTLHIGDTISIKASYSEALSKIVDTDKKIREFSKRLQDAKQKGMDVSEAEAHLTNAMNYNNNQALGEFWKKNTSAVLEYVGYANDELSKAEEIFSSASRVGSLKISSNPSGAEVYLDNVYKGKTPLTLTKLQPGAHTLVLKKSGYSELLQSVNIEAGNTTEVHASMKPSLPVGISVVIISIIGAYITLRKKENRE